MTELVCMPNLVQLLYREIESMCNRCLKLIVSVGFLAFVASGCEGRSLGATETGALGGAGLGAGLGAIIGHSVGSTGAGVAIGSAFGALTGGLVGNSIDSTNKHIDANAQRLANQDRMLEENRKIIDELRSRGTDAKVTDRGVVINLPDVLFEFGSDRLTSGAVATAREIASVVQDSPGRHIAVEGHTDSVGTLEYNQRLSEDRAHAVASQLVAEGISRGRISTRGYGETKPIASNGSDSGRQRNRRVEVIIENR